MKGFESLIILQNPFPAKVHKSLVCNTKVDFRGLVTRCQGFDLIIVFSVKNLGGLKIALRGGGGVTWTPAKGGGGGGVGEMGFRVGPFVLCKNGCWRRRRRNTKFWPEKVFSTNNSSPPHLSSQNDEHDMGIILSHRCWVDPPPPWHGRSGTPALNPPSRHGGQGGGGGGMGFRVTPPPPPQSNFLPALVVWLAVLL